MARNVVAVEFGPILEQVCECLGFSKPFYDRIDVVTNVGFVIVETNTPPVAYRIVGEEKSSLYESCETAAQQMCVYLVSKFKIRVLDINLEMRVECEKVRQLFESKTASLNRFQQQLPPLESHVINPVMGVDYSSKEVVVDFVGFLRTVVRKLEIGLTPIQYLPMANDKFLCWLTVDAPGTDFDSLPVVGDYCSSVFESKQSLAKKTLELLMKLFGFDIMDVNYCLLKSSITGYITEKLKYINVKECVYGVKENRGFAPVLTEEEIVSVEDVKMKKLLADNAPLSPRVAALENMIRSFADTNPAVIPRPLVIGKKRQRED